MLLQISSGNGPAECELAVAKMLDVLQHEDSELVVISQKAGQQRGCFASVLIRSDANLAPLQGSVLWICQSPYRPYHKRKNWFITLHVLEEPSAPTDNGDVRFETFRSGGHGGQHVNKTESGVRAVHLATGLSAVSTAERSQLLNKKTALRCLRAQLAEAAFQEKSKADNLAWRKHMQLVRGNPVRTYSGERFLLVSQETPR